MRWQKIESGGPQPQARGGHTVTTVGERVFLFGGCSYLGGTSSSSPTAVTPAPAPTSGGASTLVYHENEVWCLDLHTLTWSVVCPGGPGAPSRRYAHAAAVVGTSVVVFGGYNARETYLGDLWIFDTVTCSWREIVPRPGSGPGPAARYAHTAVAVGGTVYVFGGCAELACFRDMWALDTTTATWARLPSRGATPSPRAYHVAAVINRSIVVFGGRAGATYYNDMFTFDIDACVWAKVEQRGAIPPEIAYHAAAAINGKLFVFGGMDGKNLFNSVNVFSPATLSWERLEGPAIEGVAPSARHKHAVCTFGPCMLAVCGMNLPPISFSDSFVLETQTTFTSQQQQQQQQQSPAPMTLMSPQPQPTAVATTRQSPTSTAAAQQPAAITATSPTTFPKQESSAQLKQLEAECSELKEELRRLYKDLERLRGQELEGLSYYELESLESVHFDGLRAIAQAKRSSIEEEVRRRLARQEAEHARHIAELEKQVADAAALAQSAPRVVTSGTATAVPTTPTKQRLDELQEQLTTEQNKNLRLRRRLRAAGIDPDDGQIPRRRGAAVGVGWGTVETREYEPAQSRDSVPSTGAAPLGLGDAPIATWKERVEGFERRREPERKGVNRVPEEQRREVLAKAGVPPTSIDAEAEVISRINWGRIESLASPTDNPLPVCEKKL